MHLRLLLETALELQKEGPQTLLFLSTRCAIFKNFVQSFLGQVISTKNGEI